MGTKAFNLLNPLLINEVAINHLDGITHKFPLKMALTPWSLMPNPSPYTGVVHVTHPTQILGQSG